MLETTKRRHRLSNKIINPPKNKKPPTENQSAKDEKSFAVPPCFVKNALMNTNIFPTVNARPTLQNTRTMPLTAPSAVHLPIGI